VKLKAGTGLPSVIAATDSALYKHGGGTIREGFDNTPALGGALGTPTYGEISPRAAFPDNNNLAFAAFVQVSLPTPISGVFFNGAKIVLSGDIVTDPLGNPAPLSPTAAPVYSAFLGEGAVASTATSSLIFRALMKSDKAAGVSTSNNEGLWVKSGAGNVRLLARKGGLIGSTGLSWSKFIDFGIDYYEDVLILAQVTGTGVTSSNDMVLVQLRLGVVNSAEILLREGSAAPGCDGARIATVGAVDMAFNGIQCSYGVLATLVVEKGGATAANNLVWLSGNLAYGTGSQPSMRLPSAHLRKGERYTTTPGQDLITTLSFPTAVRDASGAGNTGMAHIMSPDQDTTAVVTFPNKSTAVITKLR